MNRATPTPAASRNMRFHSDQPLTGLVKRRRGVRVEPELARRLAGAQRVVRIGDHEHALQAAVAQDPSGGRQGLPRRRALDLAEDGAVGHTAGDQVVRRRRGLREAVAGPLAAGDDDPRRVPGLPEQRARGRGGRPGPGTAGRRTARRRGRRWRRPGGPRRCGRCARPGRGRRGSSRRPRRSPRRRPAAPGGANAAAGAGGRRDGAADPARPAWRRRPGCPARRAATAGAWSEPGSGGA